MREVVISIDILLANSNHPYFLIMDWSNKIALLRIPTECILTKRLESTVRFHIRLLVPMYCGLHFQLRRAHCSSYYGGQ
jgi:hypothetical protein